jgi:hypothetical protein
VRFAPRLIRRKIEVGPRGVGGDRPKGTMALHVIDHCLAQLVTTVLRENSG